MDESTQVPADGQFPPTMWIEIQIATDEDGPEALAALERLARVYWPPLNSWLLRNGVKPEDAADLTQSFFAHLIEKQILRHVARENGRFRTFLLTCLRNHFFDWWDMETADRRGPRNKETINETTDGGEPLIDPPGPGAPDEDCDHKWALLLLDRAKQRLQSEYFRAGKAELFDHLQNFLYGAQDKTASHAEAATRLGMTEGAIKTAGSRLKKRYGELIRAEIRPTVGSEEEVELELRELFAIISTRR